MDGKNKMHDALHALQDSATLSMIIAILWDIDNGMSIEDLKAELQYLREEWTEKLMKTESGRKQLEVMRKNMSILTDDEEEK